MKFVDNRSFIVIKPKKPLVDWVNNYDEDKIPENEILSIKTLYMVDSLENDSSENILKLIKKRYKEIFINELFSWYVDEDYLPKNMTFNLFNEWFEYEYIDMCFDILNSQVIIE